MCRTSDAMKVMNRDPLNIISSVNNTDAELWLQIIQAEGLAVGSCYNKEKKSPEVTLLDPKSLQKSRSIYKTTVDKFTYYKIAQHLFTVYILNSEEKQLVVCNLVDNEIQELPVPEMKNPRNLCILPDSTILLADKTKDGGVRRYKVENKTLTQMWEFPHISDPTGISFDPTSELIYICTGDGPLFILSLEGK